MQILIDIPDSYEAEEGTAFDAVHAALEHFYIPATMRQLATPSTNSEPPIDLDVAVAQAIINVAASLSTDELDDWYEERVGYRPSADDPSLVGDPEHAYLIAELMCLHAHGPKGPYVELCRLLADLRNDASPDQGDTSARYVFPAPRNLLKRLTAVGAGKQLEKDYKTAFARVCYPFFELSKEQYAEISQMAGNSDVLLLDDTIQVTFAVSANQYRLMPLWNPL